MTITRNVGADLLPFVPRPSYPTARLKAIQNARARRDREAPDPTFDAARLERDLASLPSDTPTRRALRERGWTDDEVLAQAQADLRKSLVQRVGCVDERGEEVTCPDNRVDREEYAVTAGAVMATHAAPIVASIVPRDRLVREHAARALAAGTDAATVDDWVRWQLGKRRAS